MFRKIIKKSWQTIWNHKHLWFFGFFVTFLGIINEYYVIFRAFSGNVEANLFPNIRKMWEVGFFSYETLESIKLLFQNNPVDGAKFFITIVVGIFVFCFLAWMSVLSQIGLIHNNHKININKKKSSNLDIKMGLKKGMEKFWPIFGLNILIQSTATIFLVVISLIIYFSKLDFLYITLLLIATPIIVISIFIIRYAICFIIIKNDNVKDAIKKAYHLFINNWLISLEIATLLFIIKFIVTIISTFFTSILTQIFLFILIIISSKISSAAGVWLVTGALFLTMMFVTVTIGAIVTAFQVVIWVNVFSRLTNKNQKLESKLERFVEEKKVNYQNKLNIKKAKKSENEEIAEKEEERDEDKEGEYKEEDDKISN